jgi:lipoprotein-anchoring transpeptidase ErfK/SrfK
MRSHGWIAALLLAACTVSDSSETRAPSSIPPAGPAPIASATPESTADSAAGAIAGDSVALADMRLEVDTQKRELHVFRGDQRVATHSVAVGSPEWPTKTGEWRVRQVVFNPEWVPPDESWAEQREPRQPGDPKNPLGRAQLIYDPPRTIHGTNDPQSIGQAVSHGSIRLPNSVIVELAREAMRAAGVEKDEAWYRGVQQERTRKEIVDLPRQIPIRVY